MYNYYELLLMSTNKFSKKFTFKIKTIVCDYGDGQAISVGEKERKKRGILYDLLDGRFSTFEYKSFNHEILMSDTMQCNQTL